MSNMYGFMSQKLPCRLTYNYVWFPENSLNTQHIKHDLITTNSDFEFIGLFHYCLNHREYICIYSYICCDHKFCCTCCRIIGYIKCYNSISTQLAIYSYIPNKLYIICIDCHLSAAKDLLHAYFQPILVIYIIICSLFIYSKAIKLCHVLKETLQHSEAQAIQGLMDR